MPEIKPIDPVVTETRQDERQRYWGSDPAPFDIDGYVNDWNLTNPIEEQADRRTSFANVMHKISRPFLSQGYNGAAALNRGLAGFSAHLDSISDFISISTGTEKGGVFEDAAKLYEKNADYWRKRAEDIGIGFVDELVSEAVGGFVPGVTQFSLDVASGLTLPYMAGAAKAAKRDESPFMGGILEAAKTGTLAALFRAMAPLKKYLQAPTMGTVFGLQEMESAPSGQKARGFAKGVGIGIGYSLVTPGGRMGLNEIKKGIEPDLKAARDIARDGKDYAIEKLKEQRGSTGEKKDYIANPAIKIKGQIIEGDYSKGGHIEIINKIDKDPVLKAAFDAGRYQEGATTSDGKFVERKSDIDFADIKGREVGEIKDSLVTEDYVYSGVPHPSIKSNYASDLPNMAAHFAEQQQAIGGPNPGKTGEGTIRVYKKSDAIQNEAQNEFSIKENAKPVAEITPQEARNLTNINIDQKKRPRKFLKTVEEATETAPELKEALENGILYTEGDKTGVKIPKDYIVQPNAESLAKADARIAESLTETVDYALGDAKLTAEKGATFIQLMRKFEKEGDFDRAVEMTEAYDRQLREAGRFVQAASIWNKLSPQGFIRWANKQLEATRKKYSWADTILRNKPESFKLSKEEQTEIFKRMTEINAMPEGAEKTNATLEMIDIVASKVPPSVSELIDAYRYQNMLSSPRTQMRNIGENIANTFVTRPVDITLKGAIDFVQSSLTGKQRKAYAQDVVTYMKSSINAVPNAANAFMSVWRLEQGAEIGKPDIGFNVKGEFAKARMKQMPAALTIVGRFMEASDKFNSALIGAGEFAVMKKRGATDAEAYARANMLAEKYIYRDKLDPTDPDLSYFSKALSSLGKMMNESRKLPILGTLSKWYVPFLRTPINKGMQMIERSPLGLVRGKIDQEAAAKILGGSIATAIGATFALQGNTTWAPPSDPTEKAWFYASGRKPFSVRMGDKWIPFWYFGPFALSFGIPAAVKNYTVDQKQAMTEGQLDYMLKISEGLAQFVGSQSSTQSIGAFFQAASGDIDFTFPQTTAFTLEQLIPANGLIRYINTMIDPAYRKSESFLDQIKKDIPYLSQQLEARMTPLLEESKREMHNYFLPYDVGIVKPVYEGMLPIKRHEQRQKYLKSQMKKLVDDMNSGKLEPEDSFEKLQKILEGGPESLKMLGNELKLKQQGDKK